MNTYYERHAFVKSDFPLIFHLDTRDAEEQHPDSEAPDDEVTGIQPDAPDDKAEGSSPDASLGKDNSES